MAAKRKNASTKKPAAKKAAPPKAKETLKQKAERLAKKKLEGRPARYPTPEAMQKKGDEYFKNEKKPTVSGLHVHLGLTKQAMNQYEKNDAFLDLIKSWRLRVEAIAERNLLHGDKNAAGSIFWLKNHAGYADRQEHALTGGLNVTIQQNDSDLL